MEKKIYEKPVLHAERFIPNHYCANCVEGFRVRCYVGDSNNGLDEIPQYLKLLDGGAYPDLSVKYTTSKDESWSYWENSNSHSATEGCGDKYNQVITGNATDGWTWYEKGKTGLTTQEFTVSNVEVGAEVAWNTTSTNQRGTRIWHHHGKITDFQSSNHS